ncbi:MAG: lipid-A-disaccharide synthase [Kangiellaceae bacterium]|jgi:lipid-A-disaccharide synthase|nr:lipid-A-disaccharide synthase [Kangiellaceae bacterium]
MTHKKIFIVAGEASGDTLGAGLISQLTKLYDGNIEFSGIAGPKMLAQGCQSVYPIERLSVMGIWSVLKRYRELTKVRAKLIQQLIADPPDIFIGIDAPEFNLDFELKLKAAGIKTCHYVSPSVWAWRPKRIFKIKKAVDLMLCLFTFEQSYYQQHEIPVVCVGHPLADKIPMDIDTVKSKATLGISPSKNVLAVLPGSRSSEIKYIAEPFIKAAELCWQRDNGLEVIVPVVNEQRKQQFESIVNQLDLNLPLTITVANAHEVMAAADVILIASGTATLEATLYKKPMVVGYKMSSFSYGVFSRMLKISSVSLPNLLAGKPVVKELLQTDCTPEKLSNELLVLLNDKSERDRMVKPFKEIHQSLKKDADVISAQAIYNLLEIT